MRPKTLPRPGRGKGVERPLPFPHLHRSTFSFTLCYVMLTPGGGSAKNSTAGTRIHSKYHGKGNGTINIRN